MPAEKSFIKVDRQSGRRHLVVFYDPAKDDFNEAIARAYKFHGLKPGMLTVLAIPDRQYQ